VETALSRLKAAQDELKTEAEKCLAIIQENNADTELIEAARQPLKPGENPLTVFELIITNKIGEHDKKIQEMLKPRIPKPLRTEMIRN
jgi:hypothetical protein